MISTPSLRPSISSGVGHASYFADATNSPNPPPYGPSDTIESIPRGIEARRWRSRSAGDTPDFESALGSDPGSIRAKCRGSSNRSSEDCSRRPCGRVVPTSISTTEHARSIARFHSHLGRIRSDCIRRASPAPRSEQPSRRFGGIDASVETSGATVERMNDRSARLSGPSIRRSSGDDEVECDEVSPTIREPPGIRATPARTPGVQADGSVISSPPSCGGPSGECRRCGSSPPRRGCPLGPSP